MTRRAPTALAICFILLLGADAATAACFENDRKAGDRAASHLVSVGGGAQWMADINGDGRADYFYNRNGTGEYWMMLGKADGTFATAAKAGTERTPLGCEPNGLPASHDSWSANQNVCQ